MLDWLNAVITLFGEFVAVLFELPFYMVPVGYYLLAIVIVGIVLVKIIR